MRTKFGSGSVVRLGVAATAFMAAAAAADPASAQTVIYETWRPVVPVVAAPAYVANYTPAGNYAAVTAFSPPVYAPSAPLAATVPASSVAVTSYYAPAMSTATPVTAFYAPAVVEPVAATVSYAPVVAAPVTTYYAPAAVAVPLYRRGPFGGLRPVRAW